MGDAERTVLLVRGHKPARPPEGGVDVAGMVPLALVLSTHRSGRADLVVDHELWAACLEAVGTVVGARDAEVWLERRRGFFAWLLRKKSRPGGSLAAYLAAGGSAEDWHTLIFRKAGNVVAVGTCERWYQSGGPAPYHDSYTTALFVDRPAAGRLGAVLRVAVARVGGSFLGMVDAALPAAPPTHGRAIEL